MSVAKKTDQERIADANEIIRVKNREISDLRTALRAAQHDGDTAEAIRREIFAIAERSPEPPAWVNGTGGKIGRRGCPITILSDIHYGEVIDADQTGGMNKYNSDIAKQRIVRYFDTVGDLAYNHMGRAKTEYPGIICCFGGDMIGGNIHEELAWTNDRTPHQSVNDLTDILAAGIEHMATQFGKVFIPCVVGNHGRSTKKNVAKGRVYTNYDWSIYCNLERYFRKEKHVQFLVPPSADAHFNSFGTHYMLTHGDSLGVKGGDGIIGAIGPIMRGTIKVRNSEMQIGRDVDHVILCHWHQMLWLPGVTVNNALKGYDEYAMLGLRAPYSRPSQALWFNHPEHGITARWEIFLEGRKKAQEKAWVSWQS